LARIIVLLVLAALLALALMGYLVKPPGEVPFPPVRLRGRAPARGAPPAGYSEGYAPHTPLPPRASGGRLGLGGIPKYLRYVPGLLGLLARPAEYAAATAGRWSPSSRWRHGRGTS
jgi:hypothetical protein